jgi:hypothetical protein
MSHWIVAACALACLFGCVSSTPPAPYDGPGVRYEGGDGPGQGRHIVLVAGDEEYRSEEALPALAKILSVHHGFTCTVLFALDEANETIDPDARGNIPGLSVVDEADMLVLFTRFRRLPDEDMAHIVDYIEAGKPVLGIRTATHAFAYEQDSTSPYAHWTWNDSGWSGGFGRQVLGETWINHHGRHGSESTRGVIPRRVSRHPILRGVEDIWGPTDVYGIKQLPDDALVLVRGAVLDSMEPDGTIVDDPRNDPMMPIIWLRSRELDGGVTQRVIGSTIGASVDLASAGLRRTLVNACYWAQGMEDDIADRSVVDLVGDYAPTMFGFGASVKGVRPQDHELPVDDS